MAARPFDGIPGILDRLATAGVRIALVTGKGVGSCRITLDRYGISHYFERIETGSPDGPSKPRGIDAVLRHFALRPDEAVYVGDAPSDITACRQCGVPVIAAAWALTAEPELLESLEPDWLCHTIDDLQNTLEELIRR